MEDWLDSLPTCLCLGSVLDWIWKLKKGQKTWLFKINSKTNQDEWLWWNDCMKKECRSYKWCADFNFLDFPDNSREFEKLNWINCIESFYAGIKIKITKWIQAIKKIINRFDMLYLDLYILLPI